MPSQGVKFGSGSFVYQNSEVITSAPLTIALWCRIGSSGNIIASISSTIEHFHFFGLRISGSSIVAYAKGPAWSANSIKGHGKATGDLAHFAGVFTSSTSRQVFSDGLAGNLNTVEQVPLSLNSINVSGLRIPGPSHALTYDETIYHAAFWNRALTASEVAELADGCDPRLIHPGNLVRYLPLDGAASGANEIIEPSTWSINNTLLDGPGDTTLTKELFFISANSSFGFSNAANIADASISYFPHGESFAGELRGASFESELRGKSFAGILKGDSFRGTI